MSPIVVGPQWATFWTTIGEHKRSCQGPHYTSNSRSLVDHMGEEKTTRSKMSTLPLSRIVGEAQRQKWLPMTNWLLTKYKNTPWPPLGEWPSEPWMINWMNFLVLRLFSLICNVHRCRCLVKLQLQMESHSIPKPWKKHTIIVYKIYISHNNCNFLNLLIMPRIRLKTS